MLVFHPFNLNNDAGSWYLDFLFSYIFQSYNNFLLSIVHIVCWHCCYNYLQFIHVSSNVQINKFFRLRTALTLAFKMKRKKEKKIYSPITKLSMHIHHRRAGRQRPGQLN